MGGQAGGDKATGAYQETGLTVNRASISIPASWRGRTLMAVGALVFRARQSQQDTHSRGQKTRSSTRLINHKHEASTLRGTSKSERSSEGPLKLKLASQSGQSAIFQGARTYSLDSLALKSTAAHAQKMWKQRCVAHHLVFFTVRHSGQEAPAAICPPLFYDDETLLSVMPEAFIKALSWAGTVN